MAWVLRFMQQMQPAAGGRAGNCVWVVAAPHPRCLGLHFHIALVPHTGAQALVGTTLAQQEARRYEDAQAGRYKPVGAGSRTAAATAGGAPSADGAAAEERGEGAVDGIAALAAEALRSRQKQERIHAAVLEAAAEAQGAHDPDSSEKAAAARAALDRVLAHAAVAIECSSGGGSPQQH